jgi:hypothetical protein
LASAILAALMIRGAKERSDEARRRDEAAIRLGRKLRMDLHLSLADRFDAGWINDRYFDRNMKLLRGGMRIFSRGTPV